MGEGITSFLWRGKNPPPAGENPPMTTEKVKDLTEGLKSISELEQAIQTVKGFGGAKMEKPSDLIKEANELVQETEKFTQRMSASPAEQVKGIREIMEEAKKLTEIVEGKKERKRTSYTVLDDGAIVPDLDGEMTLGEALLASRNLKQSTGPSFFYQDPTTHEFKEATGPVLVHQPTPPVVFQVTPEGEIMEIKPGQPIIVKQHAAAAQGKSWVIKPDGGVEEYEPGKPIVIVQPSAPSSPIPTLPIQPTDSKGSPIGGAIPMPLPQFLEYAKSMQEIKHEEEKHKVAMDVLSTAKEEIPRIARAVERQTKKGGGESKGTSEEMDIRTCQHCGISFATPKGMTEVLCPNPQCPANKVA